jgi:outer membrane protein assembly factor BamE (lipoprotein component of BamABCDE complex)
MHAVHLTITSVGIMAFFVSMQGFPRAVAIALVACVALAACEPTVVQRGQPPLAELKQKLTSDVKTKEDVLRVLGSPSTTSDYGALTWYYISAERESVAIFAPDTTRQDVLRIVFDDTGAISAISTKELKDAKLVSISSRETPTEGHELGFVEQIIGNVGRFNGSDKKQHDPRTLKRPGQRY